MPIAAKITEVLYARMLNVVGGMDFFMRVTALLLPVEEDDDY